MAGRSGTPGGLGLPREGPGSLATFGRRLLAYLVDSAVAVLIALIFTNPPGAAYSSAVVIAFVVERILLTALTGQSLGERVAGIGVRRLDGKPVGFARAAIRTLLIVPLIPIFLVDRTGRGLHDRSAGTVLIQTR